MKNNTIKKIFILLLLFLLFISISAFSYVNTVSAHISDSVFRLHVLANSDSMADQELKYKVRDKILEYMDSMSSDAKSKSDVMDIAHNNIEEFKKIANEVIKDNGYDYSVSVQIGNFSFPTKTYGDVSLPAGFYDALRVEIGSAKGQNWWCVMFPPLCFVDVSSGIVPEDSKELMQANLGNEEYDLISNDNPEVKFKFKILELFQNITGNTMASKN